MNMGASTRCVLGAMDMCASTQDVLGAGQTQDATRKDTQDEELAGLHASLKALKAQCTGKEAHDEESAVLHESLEALKVQCRGKETQDEEFEELAVLHASLEALKVHCRAAGQASSWNTTLPESVRECTAVRGCVDSVQLEHMQSEHKPAHEHLQRRDCHKGVHKPSIDEAAAECESPRRSTSQRMLRMLD